MAFNPKSLENLKKWPKGTSGNPKGRARKVVNMPELEGIAYTKAELRAVCATMSGMTSKEIKKVIDSKDSSILEKTIATSFEKAVDKGEYSLIKDIIEIFAGKPQQEHAIASDTEVTINIGGTEEKDKP